MNLIAENIEVIHADIFQDTEGNLLLIIFANFPTIGIQVIVSNILGKLPRDEFINQVNQLVNPKGKIQIIRRKEK
jgi:hypothetical protein